MKAQLFINGAWQPGRGATFERRDPASDQVVWRGAAADAADVEAALQHARNAFGPWSRCGAAERSAVLQRYAQQLEARKEALARTIALEIGKPLWEARTEVGAMIGKIALSMKAYEERTGTRELAAEGGRHILRHRPHGVVAVFGPYNFPGHLPNGHIVPALLAGNCGVFKPSEQAPATAEMTMTLWEAAGLPAGVLQLLQGERATGEAIAQHPALDGLFFTGSSRTGALLHRQFGGQPGKILALEMGGNNPLIVRPLTESRAAIHDVIQSAFLTSGQRCTCARRLLVPGDAFGEAFVGQLSAATSGIRVDRWDAEPPPFMGPVVSARTAASLLAAQQHLLDQGATSVLPMTRLPLGPAFVSPGIVDVTAVHDRPDEEYFGPLLQVIRYQTLDEAIEIANQTQYGLSAGMLGDDPAEFEYFLQRARAGIINWNRPTTGASGSFPFGGIGASGNHRASAYYAADYCAYPVASAEAAASVLPKTPLPGLAA